MDLKDLLEKNKSKLGKKPTVIKSVEIADQYRPYSDQDNPYFIPEIKVEPKLSPTRVKLEPKLGQLDPNLSQSKAKVETELEPEVEPKLSQEKDKITTINLSQTEAKLEPTTEFSLLGGLQKQVTIFIFEECQTALDEETPGLTIEYIAINCHTTKPAIRKALQRLEKKKIIIRSYFKNGRGGWTRYKLPSYVYQEIHRLKSLNKLEPNLSQVPVRRIHKVEPELKPEVEPSSSRRRSLDNKKESSNELSLEWLFDLTPYQRSNFGIGRAHIRQIANRGVLTPPQVEDSLNEYCHDLDLGVLAEKKILEPLNYFMKIVKANDMPYTSVTYRNELQAEIAEMAMRARTKNRRLLEEKFEAWIATLTEDQQKEIESKLPVHLIACYRMRNIDDINVRKWLFDYFMQQVS